MLKLLSKGLISNKKLEMKKMPGIRKFIMRLRKPVALLLTLTLVFEGLFMAFPNIAHAAADCTNTGVTGVTQTECEALIAFYNSTGGSGWTTKTNWDTATAVSTWYKVTVSGGHVTKLEFPSGNNMIGSLPTELSNLTYLRTLTIASNAGITGSLPSSLGSVTTLTSLNIYSTGISGTIPSSYANLTSLSNFYVNNNLLSGSVPEIFSGMTNLQYVLLEGNQFTGTIPANWPNSLDWLWAYTNQFTGPVPSTLASIPLQQLKIEDNKLVFSDFESQFATYSGFSVFTYSTQKNVDTVRSVMVDDGAVATITPSVAANANDAYQWYKDGGIIAGATSRVFTKTAAASDAGVYSYRITNSVVTGLTLQSNNITLGINPNPPTSDSVYYIVDATGANIYVRGAISATKDIAQKYTANVVAGDNNGNINIGTAYIISSTTPNLVSSYVAGTTLGGAGDEAAPVLTTNVGYIMENHGLLVPVVTSNGHGKVNADIGSVWSNGGRNFVLAEINDANTLTFFSQPYDYASSWGMSYTITGTLTHVSGATNQGAITVGSSTFTQKYPMVKNLTRHILVNGTDEASNNTGGYANYVDLTEEFDLIDPSTMVQSNNPFNWNDATGVWMHVKTVYRATGGRTVIHTTYDIERPINLLYGYMGFIQTSGISAPSYDHQYYYIPKTRPVTDISDDEYNFKAIQLLDEAPASTLVFNNAVIDDVNNPPNREIRLLKNTADTKYDVGLAFGYSPYLDSAPENRSCTSYDLGCWRVSSSTRKTYPIVDGGIGVIDSPTSYEVYAYRQWIDPTVTGQGKLAYWNNMNGHDLVYVDYHKSVTNDVTALPTSMVGKSIRVVESENVTVADTVVASGGVTLSTTGANTYGYAVLELTAQDPVLQSTACPSESAWCNDATPDISVSNAVAGQHYHYLVNQTAAPAASAVQSGTADADGAFTVGAGVISSEGTWYVHVVTQSENGDFSNNFDTYTIKYDGTIPTASLTASPLVADGNNGWYKTRPSLTLSVVDNLSGVGTTRFFWDMDGESTYATALTAPEGIHTLNYYGRDNAENSSLTGTQEFKTDTVAPVDFTPTADPASATGKNSVAVSFATSDTTSGMAGYSIKLDSGAYINNITSPYALDVTSVADGSHTVTVKASDNAGNFREKSVNIYLDKTVPVISGGAPSGTLSNTASSISLAVTTDEAATCKYSSTAGTDYATMASSFTTTGGTTHSTTISGIQSNQYYLFYIRCQDGAGNINSADYTVRFTVANVPRRPPIFRTPILAGGASPNITLVGEATSAQTVKIFFDGRVVKTISLGGTTGQTKKFSTTIALSRYATGTHQVYAKAYDAAGQPTEASKIIKINIARSTGKTRVMVNAGASYVVKVGDSLWNIARTFLGFGSRYTKIANYNIANIPALLKHPGLIIAGWVLRIPAN